MKNAFILLIVLSMTFVSCEKFDEGGSVGKADKTITETLWVVESATDLEDNSNITADYAGEVWEFTEDLQFKINSKLKGTYEFTENNLNFTIINNEGNDTDTYWIDRLDSEAMWLIILGEEELHFIPY